MFLCPSQSVRFSSRGKKEVSMSPTAQIFIRFSFKKSHLKEKVLNISLSQPECEVLFQREEGSVHVRYDSGVNTPKHTEKIQKDTLGYRYKMQEDVFLKSSDHE